MLFLLGRGSVFEASSYLARALVRIPRPKVGKHTCQTKGEGIFAKRKHSCQQKTHFCLPTKVRFLNDVCLWQMMLAPPMMTASPNDAWLRHILWQTSHHCDQRAQHHICEANASYRRRRCIIFKIQGYSLIYFRKRVFTFEFSVFSITQLFRHGFFS